MYSPLINLRDASLVLRYSRIVTFPTSEPSHQVYFPLWPTQNLLNEVDVKKRLLLQLSLH